MKTTKQKSALISALVFIYFLSVKPTVRIILIGIYKSIVSLFCLMFFAVLIFIIGYNYFGADVYALNCLVTMGLSFLSMVLVIYFGGDKIEQLLTIYE